MYISPLLVTDIQQMTDALDLFDTDLPASIQLLEDAATMAIGSLRGWTLTISVNTQAVTLTSVQPRPLDNGHIRASLRVPVVTVSGSDAQVILVLYADQQGAFRQFVTDVAAALHMPPAVLDVDRDLSPTLVAGVTGLSEMSRINQAIGMLVEHGYTIEAAEAQTPTGSVNQRSQRLPTRQSPSRQTGSKSTRTPVTDP